MAVISSAPPFWRTLNGTGVYSVVSLSSDKLQVLTTSCQTSCWQACSLFKIWKQQLTKLKTAFFFWKRKRYPVFNGHRAAKCLNDLRQNVFSLAHRIEEKSLDTLIYIRTHLKQLLGFYFIYIFLRFYFMYIGCFAYVLGACRSQKRGVMDGCEQPCGCWESNPVLCKSNRCSRLLTHLFSPASLFLTDSNIICSFDLQHGVLKYGLYNIQVMQNIICSHLLSNESYSLSNRMFLILLSTYSW